MKIQKPSLGRVVIFTAWRGQGAESGKVNEYAGIVVKVHPRVQLVDNVPEATDHAGDKIDIVTLGPSSVYHNNEVRFDADGAPGTWRYPPFGNDEIEV